MKKTTKTLCTAVVVLFSVLLFSTGMSKDVSAASAKTKTAKTKSAYSKFLKTDTYKRYCGASDDYYYAVVDINRDAIPELLIHDKGFMGWFNLNVFTYNWKTQKIVQVKKDWYYWSQIGYSKKLKSLCHMEIRPTAYYLYKDLYTLKGKKLKKSYSYGYEKNSKGKKKYYFYKASKKKKSKISSSKFKSYDKGVKWVKFKAVQ